MELTAQQKAAIKGSIVDPDVAALLIALLEADLPARVEALEEA